MKRPTKKQVRTAVCALLLVAAAGSAFWMFHRYQVNAAAYDANVKSIAKWEGTIANDKAKQKELKNSTKQTVSSAQEKGMAVAKAQTEYQNLLGNNDALKQNATAMDGYFGDDAKNARTPWFINGTDEPVSYTWTFQSTYTYVGNKVNVVWTCNDSKGALLAITTGVYDTDKGTFSDVTVLTTAMGGKYYSVNTEDAIKYDEYKVEDGKVYDKDGKEVTDEMTKNSVLAHNDIVAHPDNISSIANSIRNYENSQQ